MTEEQFGETSRQLAAAMLTLFERKQIDPTDIAVLASATLGQVLSAQLGPFGAVEHLRDLADRFEREILARKPH